MSHRRRREPPSSTLLIRSCSARRTAAAPSRAGFAARMRTSPITSKNRATRGSQSISSAIVAPTTLTDRPICSHASPAVSSAFTPSMATGSENARATFAAASTIGPHGPAPVPRRPRGALLLFGMSLLLSGPAALSAPPLLRRRVHVPVPAGPDPVEPPEGVEDPRPRSRARFPCGRVPPDDGGVPPVPPEPPPLELPRRERPEPLPPGEDVPPAPPRRRHHGTHPVVPVECPPPRPGVAHPARPLLPPRVHPDDEPPDPPPGRPPDPVDPDPPEPPPRLDEVDAPDFPRSRDHHPEPLDDDRDPRFEDGPDGPDDRRDEPGEPFPDEDDRIPRRRDISPEPLPRGPPPARRVPRRFEPLDDDPPVPLDRPPPEVPPRNGFPAALARSRCASPRRPRADPGCPERVDPSVVRLFHLRSLRAADRLPFPSFVLFASRAFRATSSRHTSRASSAATANATPHPHPNAHPIHFATASTAGTARTHTGRPGRFVSTPSSAPGASVRCGRPCAGREAGGVGGAAGVASARRLVEDVAISRSLPRSTPPVRPRRAGRIRDPTASPRRTARSRRRTRRGSRRARRRPGTAGRPAGSRRAQPPRSSGLSLSPGPNPLLRLAGAALLRVRLRRLPRPLVAHVHRGSGERELRDVEDASRCAVACATPVASRIAGRLTPCSRSSRTISGARLCHRSLASRSARSSASSGTTGSATGPPRLVHAPNSSRVPKWNACRYNTWVPWIGAGWGAWTRSRSSRSPGGASTSTRTGGPATSPPQR